MKNIKLYISIVIIMISIAGLTWYNNIQIERKFSLKPGILDHIRPREVHNTSQTSVMLSKVQELSENIKSEIKYSENLCIDNEEVLFSFKLTDSYKVLSLCVSKTQPDYIVYRFGNKDDIELEFPANKEDTWSEFVYSYYFRGGEADNDGMDSNYLSFEYNGHEYEIYQEYIAKDNLINVGVKITDISTNKEIDIKGLSNSIEGSLVYLRWNEKIKTHQN